MVIRMDSTNAKTSTCSLMTEPDNGNDHRAAAIDLQAEKVARPAAPCASYCYVAFRLSRGSNGVSSAVSIVAKQAPTNPKTTPDNPQHGSSKQPGNECLCIDDINGSQYPASTPPTIIAIGSGILNCRHALNSHATTAYRIKSDSKKAV